MNGEPEIEANEAADKEAAEEGRAEVTEEAKREAAETGRRRVKPREKYSQQQYEILLRCSEKKDVTEWNHWRQRYRDAEVLLEGAALKGAWLRGANLKGARMKEADLREACLEDANLNEAELQGAYMAGARLNRTFSIRPIWKVPISITLLWKGRR